MEFAVNPAGDGHDSRGEGDANPKALIVGTILADLGSGTFLEVRGGFCRAVEIGVFDDAAMEVAAKSDIADEAGVGIEGHVELSECARPSVGFGGKKV